MEDRTLRPPAVLALSFAAGAIPSSNIAARRRASVDLRDVGSGTVSGTSLYRVAGFAPHDGSYGNGAGVPSPTAVSGDTTERCSRRSFPGRMPPGRRG